MGQKITSMVTIKSGDIGNYRRRLDNFYGKNRLPRDYIIHETKKKSKIIYTVNNLRLSNKISRIIRLIAYHRGDELEFYTIAMPTKLKETVNLLKNGD